MKKHLAHYRKGYGNAALAQILAKFSPEKIGALWETLLAASPSSKTFST